MEYVEHSDPRPEPISIARCRELLGDEAESMTDQEIALIRRHAETMACMVVEIYLEHRGTCRVEPCLANAPCLCPRMGLSCRPWSAR